MGLYILVIGSVLLLNVVDGSCFSRSKCSTRKISYSIYTSTYPTGAAFDNKVDNLKLIPGAPLIILLSDHNSGGTLDLTWQLVSAYKKKGVEFNIILMELRRELKELEDSGLKKAIEFAGTCVAEFLQQVYDKWHMDNWLERTHLVGYDRGAHVAGFVGKQLRGIPRITGLNPDLSIFEEVEILDENRLEFGQADFVDIYYTSVTKPLNLPAAFGTVTFFFNDGINQPGLGTDTFYDQFRAVEYFSESIYSEKGFYGWPCTFKFHSPPRSKFCTPSGKQEEMEPVLAGLSVNRTIRGTFQVLTRDKAPFAMGRPNNPKKVGTE